MAADSSVRVPSLRLLELKTQEEFRKYDNLTQNIPRSLPEAAYCFFTRKSILTICFFLSGVVCLRSRYDFSGADAVVTVLVALWWILQEWLIHAKLLHSFLNWAGKEVHRRHHSMPYHHVSIDGLEIVGPAMLLGFIIFRCLFQSDALMLTAMATYYTMGLVYEWTHYLVHTHVPMRSPIGRLIKSSHVKHHLRDDRFWFSFTCPPLDTLLGTVPALVHSENQPDCTGKHSIH